MERIMEFPVSTGQGARLIGSIEPKMNDLVRRGLVSPAPPVVAGRRHWSPGHIAQAAQCLGLLTDDLRRRLSPGGDVTEQGSDVGSEVLE